MFVMSNKPTFWWKVSVPAVNSDTGGWTHHTFSAEFKRRTKPELDGMFVKGGMYETAAMGEVLAKELVGWRDIQQPDGSPLPVSEESRAALMAIPHMEAALWEAWVEAGIKGPAKN
jgi:hypothetical protein